MRYPCVFRAAKLTTFGNIAASGAHTWRERPTPNADPARRQLNTDLLQVASAAELVAAVKERIGHATEKAPDPVLAIEYIVTAHHDAFREHGGHVDADAYFGDALRWIEQQHGPENVIAANIQRDELTQHLVVYAVPLVETAEKIRKRSVIAGTAPDGTKRRELREYHQPAAVRLSAAHWLDGPAKLGKMQTAFSKEVGARHGLVRGIEGSRAVHTTVKEFYSQLLIAERIAEDEVPTVRAKPPAKRSDPEPKPPGFFASDSKRKQYERELAAWKLQADADKKERSAYRRERDWVAEEAPKVAKRYVVKAHLHDRERRRAETLKEANGKLQKRLNRAETRVAELEAVVGLLTPAEIQAARQRAEKAEKARNGEEVRVKIVAILDAEQSAAPRRAESDPPKPKPTPKAKPKPTPRREDPKPEPDSGPSLSM